MPQLNLKINIPDDVDVEDVIAHLNAESLCAMEEDEKLINGWEWVRDGE